MGLPIARWWGQQLEDTNAPHDCMKLTAREALTELQQRLKFGDRRQIGLLKVVEAAEELSAVEVYCWECNEDRGCPRCNGDGIFRMGRKEVYGLTGVRILKMLAPATESAMKVAGKAGGKKAK